MQKFKLEATIPEHKNWSKMISRENPLYTRNTDIRDEFQRDYTRIIHSKAYKRLKHKTQVFFSPENDHICTRIEHVTYVESISYTIANCLGLNTELTKAISVSHDLGHSPFGHEGEKILSEISKRDLGCPFWHEKNGLEFVDDIELLEDNKKFKQNLNLTYAVRDGIISHCGEINENCLRPRSEFIDLKDYKYPNQFNPYTWEGCVVKISDKISYICRDIEDAITMGLLDKHLNDLYKILDYSPEIEYINNTIIMNNLIYDLCQNSTPEKGLCFSEKALNLMNKIKEFNYNNIYLADRVQRPTKYFKLVINEIYDVLKSTYDGDNTMENLNNLSLTYPNLGEHFIKFVYNYYDFKNREYLKLKNKVLFSMDNPEDFCKLILYFISGMTDNYISEVYNELIKF